MRRWSLPILLMIWVAFAVGACRSSRHHKSKPLHILNATIVGEPVFHPRFGDLWMGTWADDGYLYLTWGDGTGLGRHYPFLGQPPKPVMTVPPPPAKPWDDMFHFIFTHTFDVVGQRLPTARLTDAGLLRVRGRPPTFDWPANPRDAIVSRNLPSGREWFNDDATVMLDRNDKPSSLLCVDGRFYLAGHSPAGHVELGWLAYSDDHGRTWHETPDSPWGPQSVFRVLMFINMGQDYRLNRDGYVYALGIGSEAAWTTDPRRDGRPDYEEGTVYLARVPRDAVADYDSYEYYAGRQGTEDAHWSQWQSQARPLPGLQSFMTASAIYHEGTGNYLFLTAAPGALFVAPHPWGPWRKAAPLFDEGQNPHWRAGGYIPGLISYGAGKTDVYFTLAGPEDRYQLHIGRVVMEVSR